MAELNLGKGLTAGKVASNVQKKLTRAQEKVLQKLGKADETKDVAFEEGVINFNKQYAEGSKLQRDLRAYLEAVKAMHESSKNLQSCLADMYEPDWYGKNEVDSIVEDCDVLWDDYHQKLVDHALISMDTYLGQFPDIKARIAKRDRKLVDFDSARHNYAATHKAKKKDGGIKITKPSSLLERATPGWAQGILSAHNVAQSSLSRSQAEEELERAQKVFEEINIDLQEELPSLWNSRVGFYVSTFQSLAGFEEKFHKEMSRLDQDLNDVLVKLEGTDTSRYVNNEPSFKFSQTVAKLSTAEDLLIASVSLESLGNLRPAVPPPPKVTPSKEMKTENIINLFDAAATPDISVTSPTEPVRYDPIAAATEGWGDDGTRPVRYDPVAAAQEQWGDDESQPAHYDPVAEAQESWDDDGSQPVREEPATDTEAPADEAPADTAEEEVTPAAAELENEEGQVTKERKKWRDASGRKWWMHRLLRRRFEHGVQVMHDYAANDTDELEMKAGEVVLVITFENPDEQDDGWLMGIKQDDWQQNKENSAKGVFPENFTQRL
uniref:Myc box-dependent-interacting protein 1 n=1 Tax=Amphiprion ocellaris TaxID=80972 RepID=A0AAQ6A3E8_AMPOC